MHTYINTSKDAYQYLRANRPAMTIYFVFVDTTQRKKHVGAQFHNLHLYDEPVGLDSTQD